MLNTDTSRDITVRQCCSECFYSDTAISSIKANSRPGFCNFCNKESQNTINPAELENLFLPLMRLFAPSRIHFSAGAEPFGSNLAELLDEHNFEIFATHLSISERCLLLDAIRQIDPDTGDSSACAYWSLDAEHFLDHKDYYAWRSLAKHLREDRRFIVDAEKIGCTTPPERWILNAIGRYCRIDKIDHHTVLYRARRGSDKVGYKRPPWPIPEMVAPPADKATAGRANPRGISFLYAGSSRDGALAEVRPEIGSSVSLRQVELNKTLRIVNLTQIKDISDPLGSSNLEEEYAATNLLQDFRYQLSRPVLSSDSDLDYLPSQYLTEIIRSGGYDGICFPSSQSSKFSNFVIFDSSSYKLSEKAELCEVTQISYEYRNLYVE